MPNRWFDKKALDLLAAPPAWRFNVRDCRAQVPVKASSQAGRLDWSLQNSHRHPHREFLFCLAGHCVFGWNGCLYACRPGDAFFLDQGDEHDCGYAPGEKGLDHLWISLSEDRAILVRHQVRDNRRGQIADTRQIFTEPDLGMRPSLAWQAEAGLPPEWRREKLRVLLQAIIVAVVARGYTPQQEPDLRQRLQADIVQAVREHIEETAGAGISLAGLAELAGYSRFHLLRLFKRHAGLTIQQEIDRCRRERVKALQRAGNSQKAIAAILGFSCPTAFSRWCRTHMAQSKGPARPQS